MCSNILTKPQGGNFRGTKQIWIDPATVAVVKTHHLHWNSIHVGSLKYGNPSSICETFKNEMNQNIPQLSRQEKSGSVFFSGEKGENPPPLMPINAFFKAQVTAAQIRGAAWCFCGPGSLGLRCHKGVGSTSTGINRATRLPNIPALSVECREAKRRRTRKPRWQAVPPVMVLKEDGLLKVCERSTRDWHDIWYHHIIQKMSYNIIWLSNIRDHGTCARLHSFICRKPSISMAHLWGQGAISHHPTLGGTEKMLSWPNLPYAVLDKHSSNVAGYHELIWTG